jgi:hypothetical protein
MCEHETDRGPPARACGRYSKTSTFESSTVLAMSSSGRVRWPSKIASLLECVATETAHRWGGLVAPRAFPEPKRVFALAPGHLVGIGVYGCYWFQGGQWQDAHCDISFPADVWASSPSDVWVVAGDDGEDGGTSTGARAHWDGKGWKVERTGEPYLNVFGFGPNDVWIDGRLRFDGRELSGGRGSALWRVAGSSSQDLWAVAWDGLWHSDGTNWTRVSEEEPLVLNSIGQTEDGRVWAAGWGGSLLYQEGDAWKRAETRGPTQLQGVVGTSLSDLWGQDFATPGLWRWDGGTWGRVEPPVGAVLGWAFPGQGVTLVSGERRDTFAQSVLYRWNGSGWTSWTTQVGCASCFFRETRHAGLWAVGSDTADPVVSASIWRYDGASWTRVFTAPWRGLVGVAFSVGPDDVWASGLEEPEGGQSTFIMLRWNGTTFEPSGPRDAYLLAGTGPSDVWAGQQSRDDPQRSWLLLYDGASWTPAPPLPIGAGLWAAVPGKRTYAITQRGAVFSHPASQ